MTKLDEMTGLPELPAGQWWRVKKERHDLRDHYGTYGYWQMKDVGVIYVMAEAEPHPAPWYAPWRKPVRKETVLERGFVRVPKPQYAGRVSYYTSESHDFDYTISEFSIRASANRLLREREERIQKQTLAAKRAIEEEKRKKAEDARVRALLGDYPPKKLGGN